MVFGEMNSISNKAAQTLHTRENCIGGGGGLFHAARRAPRAGAHTRKKRRRGGYVACTRTGAECSINIRVTLPWVLHA